MRILRSLAISLALFGVLANCTGCPSWLGGSSEKSESLISPADRLRVDHETYNVTLAGFIALRAQGVLSEEAQFIFDAARRVVWKNLTDRDALVQKGKSDAEIAPAFEEAIYAMIKAKLDYAKAKPDPTPAIDPADPLNKE